MIGIIQKTLLDMLESIGGESLRNKVLARANLPENTDFRINKNYSDVECLALIQAAKEETQLSDDEVNAAFAKQFLIYARELFPTFFSMYSTSEQFLLRQAKIHDVIAAGLQTEEEKQQVSDKFHTTAIKPGLVHVEYRSENRLCGIFTSLAYEVANYYQDELTVKCLNCFKRGDKQCKFELSWHNHHSTADS